MKYIRGFLMAWGMFCWIPCPYKKWHPEARKAQIAMLPLVGACMGAVLCLLWWCLHLIGAGQFITGAVLTASYFLMTGYIHLDGFMDCSDAIMPRHPDMAERRRILKDSTNGAFAVACLGMMLVVFAGSMVELAPCFCLENGAAVVVLLTCSRTLSAVTVLTKPPMPTSQYAMQETGGGTDSEEPKPMGTGRDAVPAIVVLAVIFPAAELLAVSGGGPAAGLGICCASAAAIISAAVTGSIDRKKLGGMNGDISGHMITVSEMFGVMVLALTLTI